MAPAKTVKRSGSAPQDVPATKKAKQQDPLLAGINEALENADLSEPCRMLLTSCSPFALTTFSDERHEAQVKVVEMIGEVLKKTQETKQQELDAEVAKATEFEAKRSELAQAKEAAAELVKTRGGELIAAKEALEVATKAKKDAAIVLEEKKEVQSTEDAGMIKSQQDKDALENMMSTAWQKIMAGEEAEAQYEEITSFFALLQADESMKSALPSCCKKAAGDRGGFDTMVLAQFEALVKEKVSALQKEVEDAGPAAKERALAVEQAQTAFDAAATTESEAQEKLAAAKEAEKTSKAELKAATATVKAYEPEYFEATLQRDEKVTAMEEWNTVSFKAFEELRDRTAPRPCEAGA